MDENIEENSPSVSENAGQSWIQCWENEIISLSGLNLENNHELSSLVEDKEIAARAVAFVVNSTRKGIVPLCADVANLMRAKRSLEKKVFKLKKENEVLRSNSSLSRQTSHSVSPTPTSLSSAQSAAVEFTLNHLTDQYRPCSRCSQCSSTVSNSPKFDKQNRQRLASLQHSPASNHGDNRRRRHSSPRGRRSCSTLPAGREITMTNAIVHMPKEADLETNDNTINSKVKREATLIINMEEETLNTEKTKLKNKHKRNAFQMSEKEDCLFKETPVQNVLEDNLQRETNLFNDKNDYDVDAQLKSSDHETLEYQCSEDDKRPLEEKGKLDEVTEMDQNGGSVTMTDHSLEKKFMETVMLNSKLAEDLGAARKEIEVLKGRLKELEMNHLARDCSDQMYFVNEVDKTRQLQYLENKDLWLNNNNSNKNSSFGKSGVANKTTPISAYYSHPLTCCKCSACKLALDRPDEILQISDVLSDDKRCFSVSHKLQVQLNDHVVVKGDRTGYIRYVGHLDGLGQPNLIFVGLELDAPAGNHDGFCNGKQYFSCDKEHGIFVPLQEIICKVSKKMSKKSQVKDDTGRNNRKKNKSPDKNTQNKQ